MRIEAKPAAQPEGKLSEMAAVQKQLVTIQKQLSSLTKQLASTADRDMRQMIQQQIRSLEQQIEMIEEQMTRLAMPASKDEAAVPSARPHGGHANIMAGSVLHTTA